MELEERVLVSESRTCLILFFCVVHFSCFVDIDESAMNTRNCDETLVNLKPA